MRSTITWHAVAIMAALLASGPVASARSVAADPPPVDVPLVVVWPEAVTAEVWPVRLGVPFPQGTLRQTQGLGVVDDAGQPAAGVQLDTAGTWPDGSIRWLHVTLHARQGAHYRLTESPRAQAPRPDVQTLTIAEQPTGERIVDTGAARYTITPAAACFTQVGVGDRPVTESASSPFYLVDSQGRRAVLAGDTLDVELAGPAYGVVRAEGTYRTEAGEAVAAARIYYHFYAGRPEVRVSHKFIVTEDTNELWFREIGMTLPLAQQGGQPAAAPAKALVTLGAPLNHTATLTGGQRLEMAQRAFPQFGKTQSRATVTRVDAAGTATLAVEAPVASEYASVASDGVSLAILVPDLPATFPKAVHLDADTLSLKLWSPDAGYELDFRTPQLMEHQFGHDWIARDNPVATQKNNAQGTARTHDFYVIPGVTGDRADTGMLPPDPGPVGRIFAQAEPAHIAASNVMGRWHPRDVERFPEVEAAIDDYYTRMVFVSQQVFPPTGYLHYGLYPYGAQPWELRDGRWYPTPHRLSRSLDYNLKRTAWILAARSADPRYFHFARRYTRFMHDIGFANGQIEGADHRGRLFQNSFHSPIVWGGKASYITYASSEDVIQFVYDYFMAGDYHSRDMVRFWTDAMIAETNWDVDKGVTDYFPAVVLLRPLGGAYELDHDPRLLEYGSRLLGRMISDDPNEVLDEAVRQNYGKMGEVFAVFYYYYTSTGDERARDVMVKLASHAYRFGTVDNIMTRQNKALPQAFAMAYDVTGDPVYAQYLRQWLRAFADNTTTMADQGLDPEAFGPTSTEDWGQATMDWQDAVGIGMPVAMRAVADYQGPAPVLPIAAKLLPTEKTWFILDRQDAEPAVLDVYVNNVGDRSEAPPQLQTLDGKPVPLEVLEQNRHRQFMPETGPGTHPIYSIWFNRYETHTFYRLRIPPSVGPGVYVLDTGDHVAATILSSDIDRIVQAAPHGMVLQRERDYFFSVPKGQADLALFAYRPVRLFDPSGQEVPVALDELGEGHIDTAGKPGVWRIRGGTDDKVTGVGATVDAMVRFHNLPLVLAMGSAARLFDFDTSRFAPATAATGTDPGPEPAWVTGRFGQALRAGNRHVALPLQPDALLAGDKVTPQAPPFEGFPYEQGTVEFWWKPLWSATDFVIDRSTIRVQLLTMDPVQIWMIVDPDNSGRTGRYNISRIDGILHKTAHPRAQWYPRAGQWAHIALIWQFDGKDSLAQLYIDGRRRAYFHYDEGIPTSLTTANLGLVDTVLRFGSAHPHSRYDGTPEVYDELRVSRIPRYDDDFEPPTEPFTPDEHTFVLMHLDGDTAATVDGRAVSGKLVHDSRLKK